MADSRDQARGHRYTCARRWEAGAGRIVFLVSVASTGWMQSVQAQNSTPTQQMLPPIEVFARDASRLSPHPATRRAAARSAATGPSTTTTSTPADETITVPSGTEPSAASEITVGGGEINARPFSRPAEALEVTPGLIVTQHSGDGKANQYFLRGFNLDHGTDFAITVDGMPVNMRTHGHGQGYADLNFLIPELIDSIDIRKGPYFADEGDFASVGAAHINLLSRISGSMASVTMGSFGYRRGLGMTSHKVGDGSLLVVGEVNTYNGPWENPDDLRKLNAMARYSQGTGDDGFSLTAMAYSNGWNSTDQIPLRAIESGEIGRYGSLDPSDGGRSGRFSLSGQWAQSSDAGVSRMNVYVIRSSLDLWNNFTYFLNDPVNGDQFHQHDDRVVGGINASHIFRTVFAGRPMETEIGLQSRYDEIDLALTNTVQRQLLSDIRSDKVQEASVGFYVRNTVRWTDWFRTTLGYRGDFYATNVASIFNAANSGKAQAAIGSPKAGIVFGPFHETELFINAGNGFHSNDARGVTITQSPVDSSPVDSSPFLVRTRGAEIGIRMRAIAGLDSALSLFILDSASEILFVGDAGDTEASRPSRRYGIEWSNRYQPASWLRFDGDIALTHARFRGNDSDQAALHAELAGYPQSQIGNAPGNYIPGAPNMIVSAGVRIGEATGWFGALRYRFFGTRPLTEDNAFTSPATGLLNGQIGYRFENGWRIQLDAFNLTNSKSDQITYAYGSLLKSDALFAQCLANIPPAAVCSMGVMDRVLHPVEPLAVRLTVAGQF
jgi:outer membrane receptor protein involved in Fe transport